MQFEASEEGENSGVKFTIAEGLILEIRHHFDWTAKLFYKELQGCFGLFYIVLKRDHRRKPQLGFSISDCTCSCSPSPLPGRNRFLFQ